MRFSLFLEQDPMGGPPGPGLGSGPPGPPGMDPMGGGPGGAPPGPLGGLGGPMGGPGGPPGMDPMGGGGAVQPPPPSPVPQTSNVWDVLGSLLSPSHDSSAETSNPKSMGTNRTEKKPSDSPLLR